MAVDGLRARNIIQLAGITSMSFSSRRQNVLTPPVVFHGCLIIFAAAQVHETRKALSLLGDCDYNGTQRSYVVGRFLRIVTSRIDAGSSRNVTVPELSSQKYGHC